MLAVAVSANPASHGEHQPLQQRGDPPVSDPFGTGSQRRTDHGKRVGPSWREAIRRAVSALDRDGALRAGWMVDEAADRVWSAVHPTSYHHLVTERGWPLERMVERTLDAVLGDRPVGAGPCSGP